MSITHHIDSNHTWFLTCVIKMATDTPQVRVFRFENYWLLHDDFAQVLKHGWNVPTNHTNKARRVVAKFKNLRRVLKGWQRTLANLASVISNNKTMLLFLDTLEESRDLSILEWNFRNIVKENLDKLLK